MKKILVTLATVLSAGSFCPGFASQETKKGNSMLEFYQVTDYVALGNMLILQMNASKETSFTAELREGLLHIELTDEKGIVTDESVKKLLIKRRIIYENGKPTGNFLAHLKK